MNLLISIILAVILLFPIHNSHGALVTQIDKKVFQEPSDGARVMGGVEFNADGTKMFTSFSNTTTGANRATDDIINEYTLSTPYDISTATYAGDSERCNAIDPDHDGSVAGDNATAKSIIAFKFSDDGKKIFTAQRGMNTNPGNSFVNRYDLTTPFDVSTCTYHSDVDIDTTALQNGTNAGDRSTNDRNNLQGIEITNDGTKLFVTMNENSGGQNIKQYNFGTPYDLSTITLASTAIVLDDNNPFGMEFSKDGKRLFQSFKNTGVVEQYSLDNAFDLSSSTKDGEFDLSSLDSNLSDMVGIRFSSNGLKIFAVHRGNASGNNVFEFGLSCAFTFVEGSCSSITENKDRTGMALAQIEIAKRTIDHSTDTALNRLKWIRRNKDKQNLTNLNINFKFTDQRLASLTEAVKTSAAKKKDKEEDVFYWSEGSIAIGRIGDTSISSTKKIDTDAITFGVDKFTDENGIKGLAFRVGRNNVDVGNSGSDLDTDTFNITYYSTTPIEDDTKFLDTFIGIGGLKSDLLTVLDGKNLTANRKGKQIYGTIRIKDEIKKDNLTFIPSGRFDIGHTILGSYKEVGSGGIDVEKQHLRTKKIRAGFAAVQDLSDDEYTLKRHGKIEYLADLDRSSDFKYNYIFDKETKYAEKLHTGSLHNINAEIGLDIVFPNRYSIFIIYERNQTIKSAHSAQNDNLYIAIGYLPYEGAEYAITINGSDNLLSKLEFKKNVNGLNLSFNVNDDLTNLGDNREANIVLNKVF